MLSPVRFKGNLSLLDMFSFLSVSRGLEQVVWTCSAFNYCCVPPGFVLGSIFSLTANSEQGRTADPFERASCART